NDWLLNGSPRTPPAIARPDVLRLRPDDAVGAALLPGVSDPTAPAAPPESLRKQLDVEAETVQQQRRIELDVGLEAAAGFVQLEEPERLRLDGAREGIE